MNGTLRVLIAEPSMMLAGGIRSLLEEAGGFYVAGVISDPAMLDERVRMTDADILLVNPSLIDWRSARNLRSAYPCFQTVKSVAIVYGIFNDDLLRQFDAVVKIVDSPSSVVMKLRHIASESADGGENTYDLTDREREILVSIARGRTNKEIADEFSISVHTVISHRKNITRKTGIKSVAGLTVYALLNNMIDRNDME